MTLVEFLLARIAEDETNPVLADLDGCQECGAGQHGITRARMLAECQAKRQIIDDAFDIAAQIDAEWGCCHSAAQIYQGKCLREDGSDYGPGRLAAVYADHPDYDQTWRPR